MSPQPDGDVKAPSTDDGGAPDDRQIQTSTADHRPLTTAGVVALTEQQVARLKSDQVGAGTATDHRAIETGDIVARRQALAALAPTR